GRGMNPRAPTRLDWSVAPRQSRARRDEAPNPLVAGPRARLSFFRSQGRLPAVERPRAMIVTGSLARADDVGCCEAECRTTDASGAALGTRTRSDMTQAQCESRFSGCDITWRPEACA